MTAADDRVLHVHVDQHSYTDGRLTIRRAAMGPAADEFLPAAPISTTVVNRTTGHLRFTGRTRTVDDSPADLSALVVDPVPGWMVRTTLRA